MATVVQSIIEPNRDAMKTHLEALFAPAREYYPDGLIEIAHGPVKPDKAAHFAVTEKGVDEAVAFALNRNAEGQNVYVGVNPRKRTTKWGVRSDDDDVEISFWHFADLDREEAVIAARQELPLKPCMIVMTGTVPHNRPHLYWRLDEPTQNMSAWTDRQRGIAQSLLGDPVINPSRIMRLAGGVNNPPPHKMERGYRPECVGLRTVFKDERPDVTPDEIRVAFPQKNLAELVNQTASQSGNTLRDMASGGKTRAHIQNAISDQNWHDNVRDLTARLARLGRTTDEIMLMAAGLTRPGYSVAETEREMREAIAGARRKWNIPEPADDEEFSNNDAPDVYESLSLDEIEDMPPPTYLIDEIVPEHGLTFIYGDPGAGKSFVALDAALRVAYGMDWHGAETKQVGVFYIAGEGRSGLGKRVTGWRKEHAMEGVNAPFKLIPVAVHMLDKPSVERLKRTILIEQEKMGFDVGLVIIDTVSRSIAGHDENKQDTMSLFVDGCAELHNFVKGAVIGVHHAGKDRERGMRGSSVLLGGCEASIKVTKDEQIVTLEVEKQKDDEEAAPIYMTMKKLEWQIGLKKPISTLVPERTNRPSIDEKELSRRQADEIFEEIDGAWVAQNPWSAFPQAKRKGRYLIDHISDTYGVSKRSAEDYVTKWQTRGYLKTETGSGGKGSGLRVLKYLEKDS